MPNFERDRQASARWSHSLLQRFDFAIIDVETTDLHGLICEIGITDPQGNTLLETLINPECKVSPDAFAKHGLSDECLASAPKLPEVWQQVQDVLAGRPLLVAYNAAFERGRLIAHTSFYDLPMLPQKWQCAMKVYAQFYGAWNDWHGSYTWQPLNGRHRAIPDCLACLGKIKEMAATYVEEARA